MWQASPPPAVATESPGEDDLGGSGSLSPALLDELQLGLVVLDTNRRLVLARSGGARSLMNEEIESSSYEALSELFLSEDEPLGPVRSRTVRIGGRIVGYTVYPSGPARWIFCRDISEKVLDDSVAGAAEVMTELGHAFSAVRHEVGNPVNSVKTALAVLRRNIDRFSRETVLEYLDGSLSDLSRVETLLGSLRALGLHRVPCVEPVAVAPLLRGFVGRAAPAAGARGVALQLREPVDAAHLRALADPHALVKVLEALVENAVDALEGRGASTVTVSASGESSASVSLCVEDEGPGVPASVRTSLFHPLVTTKPGRPGLGLAVARRLMTLMGGTVSVEPRPVKGTVATVTLRKVTGA